MTLTQISDNQPVATMANFLFKKLYLNLTSMLKNYLKITFRNLRRNKTYTFINVFGLAIGVACCLIILLYVQHELSYDTFHLQKERIFRIAAESVTGDKTSSMAVSPAPLTRVLYQEFSEVESVVRFLPEEKVLIRFGDKQFYEDGFHWVDSTVFDVFSFPLIQGNLKKALAAPNSLVISEDLANKYFGNENPIGKIVSMQARRLGESIDFTISGVVKNVPPHSHIKFSLLAPLSMLGVDGDELWSFHMFSTYVLLKDRHSASALEAKFPVIIDKYMGKTLASTGSKERFFLQPLTQIHLHSNLIGELEPNGNITYVYIFLLAAIFILFIACINFMNLATVHAMNRAKEVGVRKVIGAKRSQLIKQFLSESCFLSLVSCLIAAALVQGLLPVLNRLAGSELIIDYFSNWTYLTGIAGISLLVGLLSGIYPAFIISAYKPVEVLKGKLRTSQGLLLQKSLMVGQFAISIGLLISTSIVYQQMNYIKNKNLGFDQSQVLVLPLNDGTVREKYDVFKNTLLKHRDVIGVAASSTIPGRTVPANLVRPEGTHQNEGQVMQMLFVGHDFIPTLGMDLSAGRDFSEDFPTDEQEAFIINEEAARQFGWQTPLGKKIDWINPTTNALIKSGKVIGVVKDFHIQPLQEKIQPLVLQIMPNRFQFMYIKLAPGNGLASLQFLEHTWREIYPNHPFEFSFLNDTLTKMYQAERRLGNVFGYFSLLAIFIACIGLFGMASYTVKQRTKEMGIRKVLGASIADIIFLLSSHFIKLVFIAFLVATPGAYLMMNKWLESFSYRIAIGISSFIVAGLAAIMIAWLTISFQSVKAALGNPVNSLRNE
jgi:putative ABC transport system permease protein